MKRIAGFLVAVCATLTWLGASASDARATTVPGSVSTTGSAMCVAVRGVPYGYCLPTVKLPKLFK